MKYILSSDQLHFFEKQGYVLLEELFTPPKVEKLLVSYERHKDLASFEVRNLALVDATMCKDLFSQSIGQLASLLSQKKKLRYAGDWVWQGRRFPWKEERNSTSLASNMSVQPLAIACIVALTDGDETAQGSYDISLPVKKGDALFFRVDRPFCWEKSALNQKFLLLMYSDDAAVYVYNDHDPQVHALKKFGYGFGDRLKETTHPLIVR